MKIKDPVVVIAVMTLLAVLVVGIYWGTNASHTATLQNDQILQTGVLEIQKQVLTANSRIGHGTPDAKVFSELITQLNEADELLGKMQNGGGTKFGEFKLDADDPALLEAATLRKSVVQLSRMLGKAQWEPDAELIQRETANALADTLNGDTVTQAEATGIATAKAEQQRNQALADLVVAAQDQFTLARAATERLINQIEDRRIAHLNSAGQLRYFIAGGLLLLILGAGAFLMIRVRKTGGYIKGIRNRMAYETSTRELNAAFAEKIGSGELESEFVPDEDNELGTALVNMRDNLQQVASEDARRNWATEGLAKFAEILRGNTEDLQELSYEIISNLVKYVGANQGGLYILDSDNIEDVQNDNIEDKFLNMEACYAFERRKYKEQRVNVGEGLLGQCILERETMFMTAVPKNYVNITSGLGESNPRCLLIVPLLVNEEIYGCIEIAAFNKLEEHEVQFVEKLAESIASTISGVKINVRTARLLTESQKMTEEMRAQEEEMRQNMEELQATQEEMARKDNELTGQLRGIDSTLATAEFDMSGTVRKANKNFLQAMGFEFDEDVINLSHETFCTPEYVESGANEHLWRSLQAGEIKSAVYERIGRGGKRVWLNASYTPILEKDGMSTRVIMFAIDITGQKEQEEQIKLQLEEMRAQEEEMRQNLEEIDSIQSELDQQKDEVERVKQEEKQRADQLINAQKKILEQYIDRAKEKEQQLKGRIQELEGAST